MSKILKNLFVLLSLMLMSQTLLANEEEDLKKHFYIKLENIKQVIKNNSHNKEKIQDEIIGILTPIFDFELMAKLSLGKNQWKKMSQEDRKLFISLYTQRMKNSYSSKLDSYDDEVIKINSVEKRKNRIVLKSTIDTDDKVLKVVYKFYKPKNKKQNKDNWLIYDVEIIGISILKTDKAQFKDFLQTKNIAELMNTLASKNL